ncbi:MAG: RNA 2',3'-cyclic phosphodiesterase [Rhodocyclaceae bacterium]|nr:RNA 2',3'-cyclic phosphodiesterase [Rhodocyclaceae bacterium]
MIERHRLFFALWPPAPVREHLARLARHLARRCGGRPTPEENLHLTLAFLGDLEASHLSALYDIGASVRAPSFVLTIDQLAFWPRQRLAWAGCSSLPAEAKALVGDLQTRLAEHAFPCEGRPFLAHVTLVRRCHDVEAKRLQPLAWPVASFALVESKLAAGGSRYVRLAEWPLLPPAAEQRCQLPVEEDYLK